MTVLMLAVMSGDGAFAQRFAFEFWHTGKIILLTGDTLKGLVKYDLQQDVVQYTVQERTVEVYTARKVLYFEIFDETVEKQRVFYALPFSNASGYKSPMFFELLEDGKMTLLARERLEYKTYSSQHNIGSAVLLSIVYKYFLLNEDGEIEEYRNRNDLLDMMGKNGKKVEKFMKSNRLKLDDRSDFTQVVDYYNALETGS
jgi:hypothetical protein